MDERALADALDAWLDDLATGAPPRGELDPELADVARRYIALGLAIAPVGSRERVWRALPQPQALSPIAPIHSVARWSSTVAATLALLLITTLLSVVAFGYGRLPGPWQAGPRMALWAPEATPLAADAATRQGLLTEMPVTDLPAYAGNAAIERWSYPPASAPVTSPPLSGPMLLFVTAGQITIRLEGDAAALRGVGMTGTPAVLSPTLGTLAAGEALLVPAHVSLTTSNPDDDPATVLVTPILSDTIQDWSLPWNQTTITQDLLATVDATFAPGPVRLALRRDTLTPGETVPAPAAGTFQLVGAESRLLAYLTRSPEGEVTNRENTPIGVLILTVTPDAS